MTAERTLTQAEPCPVPDLRARANPLALDLRRVQKSFGSVKAVRGVDLIVRSGEVMAFLGPNGAGKTSTSGQVATGSFRRARQRPRPRRDGRGRRY